jgi:chemotaxis protein CheD
MSRVPYFKQPFVSAVYFDRTFNTHAVKIGPGEYHVTDKDIMIVTVLGSCISVCLRDREKRIGGMNHFMLPAPAPGVLTPISDSARYGAFAIELLTNEILNLGGRRQNLEAKVFGGGKIMATMTDIGKGNADFALRYLRVEGIPVIAADIGDCFPRKVYFSPVTGRVFVRQLHTVTDDSVYRAEQAYLDRIRKRPVDGDVELF